MGLNYRGSYWVLWQAYGKDIDDNLLIQSICAHLALAKFLEEGLCQPVTSPSLRYRSIKDEKETLLLIFINHHGCAGGINFFHTLAGQRPLRLCQPWDTACIGNKRYW